MLTAKHQIPWETSTKFKNNCILTGANCSRRLWAVRQIKRTCGDGSEDIVGVVGDKSDIVTLILDRQCLCGFLACCPRSHGDRLTTARSWGQLGSGGGGKRERGAFELRTQTRN